VWARPAVVEEVKEVAVVVAPHRPRDALVGEQAREEGTVALAELHRVPARRVGRAERPPLLRGRHPDGGQDLARDVGHRALLHDPVVAAQGGGERPVAQGVARERAPAPRAAHRGGPQHAVKRPRVAVGRGDLERRVAPQARGGGRVVGLDLDLALEALRERLAQGEAAHEAGHGGAVEVQRVLQKAGVAHL
jgi:hypothetical protein